MPQWSKQREVPYSPVERTIERTIYLNIGTGRGASNEKGGFYKKNAYTWKLPTPRPKRQRRVFMCRCQHEPIFSVF